MFNLTEAEIMANWPVNEPIRVSICCITYKQEQYIAQAIDSFLMQRTTFPFEIIIGEDCGGDGTVGILAEYQAKYPSIIKVITSDNNVGANANFLRVVHSAQGEYIATCEGDDYWLDEFKLEKQYSLLDANSGVDICFTAASAINANGFSKTLCLYKKNNFSISEVIRGGGGFMPTASIMIRQIIINKIPHWFSTAPIGDYYIQILGSIAGGAIYLPEITSVYRVGAIGSWSSSRLNISSDKILSDLNDFTININDLSMLGIELNDIKYAKAQYAFLAANELLLNGWDSDFKAIITNSWNNKRYLHKLQIFFYCFRYFPSLAKKILTFKKRYF